MIVMQVMLSCILGMCLCNNTDDVPKNIGIYTEVHHDKNGEMSCFVVAYDDANEIYAIPRRDLYFHVCNSFDEAVKKAGMLNKMIGRYDLCN